MFFDYIDVSEYFDDITIENARMTNWTRLFPSPVTRSVARKHSFIRSDDQLTRHGLEYRDQIFFPNLKKLTDVVISKAEPNEKYLRDLEKLIELVDQIGNETVLGMSALDKSNIYHYGDILAETLVNMLLFSIDQKVELTPYMYDLYSDCGFELSEDMQVHAKMGGWQD